MDDTAELMTLCHDIGRLNRQISVLRKARYDFKNGENVTLAMKINGSDFFPYPASYEALQENGMWRATLEFMSSLKENLETKREKLLSELEKVVCCE